jgi:hypothetical protein|tara:strand:- start:281 stop:403 length:123 start_codon:yes stop_codon:yes gene_type:complete
MKYIILAAMLFGFPVSAEVKTASGKAVKSDNLGVTNIGVW